VILYSAEGCLSFFTVKWFHLVSVSYFKSDLVYQKFKFHATAEE
jgi:hypothetical protein